MAIYQARTAVRRTYTLEARLVKRFEELVPIGERSKTVAELLAERVEQIKNERLNMEIREGLAYMADVYVEIASEWRSVGSDGLSIIE
jgi:metal-responsive CopG/Arc/MetJ family transcriptional regulator